MAAEPSAVIVGCCGLVCSNCGAYTRGRCQGCHSDKPMFARCPVKACVKFRQYSTCADCSVYHDLKQCGKLHNFISRIIGFLFRSNRIGNLQLIRRIGLEMFKVHKAADKKK